MAVIIIPPLIGKEFYKNGLLSDHKLITEGFAYGKQMGRFYDLNIQTYVDWGYDSIRLAKVSRYVDEYMKYASNQTSVDTIGIKIPSPIKTIGYKKTDEKIEGDNVLFMQVTRAINTGQEYIVEIDFMRNYRNNYDFGEGFGIFIEMDSSMNIISWDLGPSFGDNE